MSSELRLDWCSYEAALHAVKRWHYSRCLPGGRLVKIGVWEGGKFVGCVIFSHGACANIARPYGLTQMQVCELTRVALDQHRTPVSRIVAISLGILRRYCPGLRLVVSFADITKGHHGGIYQAGGWIYTGVADSYAIRIHGKLRHPRSIGSKYGRQDLAWLREHVDPRADRIEGLDKHRYLMPLDAETRTKVSRLAKPYPKRVGSSDGAAPGHQPGEGGSNPTPTLDARRIRKPGRGR